MCRKASKDGLFRLGAWYHRVGLIVDHVCSPVDLLTVYNILLLVCFVLCCVEKMCEKKV